MPVLNEIALNQGFIVSEANGQRSRATIKIAVSNRSLPPGTLLKGNADANPPETFTVAAAATDANAVLMNWTDASTTVAQGAAMVRDCELADAFIVSGTLDIAAVAANLALKGIILRRGVLTAPGATFAMTKASDPALANSLYGPKGLETIPTVSGGSVMGALLGAAGAVVKSVLVGGETLVENGSVETLPGGAVIPVVDMSSGSASPGGGTSTVSGGGSTVSGGSA